MDTTTLVDLEVLEMVYNHKFEILLLWHKTTTNMRLYHGDDMMYEMRRRKPESALLATQGFFNLPYHIGIV